MRNCYGELSNCELILKYGFALEGGNPFDTVSLDVDGLTAAAQRHLGKAAARKRVAFLNSHRRVAATADSRLFGGIKRCAMQQAARAITSMGCSRPADMHADSQA